MSDLLARMHALADDVLFPAAIEVDRTGVVPESHWRLLAHEGLYGLAAPPEHGGPDGLGFPEIIEGLETMAGGCLATTFTWVQHHGVVRALSETENVTLRDELLPDAVAGRLRAGVAFAGVVPDPPRMRATRVADGWMLTGDGPFVSGWGIIDVLQISAGDVETGDVVAGIVVAKEQPGITKVERLSLVAADATNTVFVAPRRLLPARRPCRLSSAASDLSCESDLRCAIQRHVSTRARGALRAPHGVSGQA